MPFSRPTTFRSSSTVLNDAGRNVSSNLTRCHNRWQLEGIGLPQTAAFGSGHVKEKDSRLACPFLMAGLRNSLGSATIRGLPALSP